MLRELSSVSQGSPYLSGFLAAVHPGACQVVIGTPLAEACSETTPPPVAAPIGGTSPGGDVSPEERIKRRLHPLDSFSRLLECAETNRPPDADDGFRFRWFGLFYQGPQQDAFLLRLRLPTGRLTAFQLIGLAIIVQEYASGYVVLNPSGGLDIPGVPVRVAAEILRRVESVGLTGRLTGGDCVQSVRGGEDDGLADDVGRASPVFSLVCQLEQSLAHNRRLADLPRACEIVFTSAGERPLPEPEGQTDCLVLEALPSIVTVPAGGMEAGHKPVFALSILSDANGGWRLPASRAVAGCLALLEAWAADADRSCRQNAGLAAFCSSRGSEEVGNLLGKAEWRAASRPSRLEASASPPGLPLPGGRLLSSQLRLIGEILCRHKLLGVRLVQGHLSLGPTANSEAWEAVRLALEGV